MWVSSNRWLAVLIAWQCVVLQHWSAVVDGATEVCNPNPTQSRLVSRVLINLIGSGPTQLSDSDRSAIEETFVSTYNQLVNCQDGAYRTAVEAEILLPQNSTETLSGVSRRDRHQRRLVQAQSFTVLVEVVIICSGDCGSLFADGTSNTRTRRRRLATRLHRRMDPLAPTGPLPKDPLLPLVPPLPLDPPLPLKKQTSKSAKAPAAPVPKQSPVPKETPMPITNASPAPQSLPPFTQTETGTPTSPDLTSQPTHEVTPSAVFTPPPISNSPIFGPQTPPPTTAPTPSAVFTPPPISNSPIFGPQTPPPSFAPVTPPPSFAPVTSPPSFAPVTPPPSFAPVTPPPSFAPVTPPPSFAPVTPPPSFAPVTPPPSFAPVTPPPTFVPATSPPTTTPVTPPPTFFPAIPPSLLPTTFPSPSPTFGGGTPEPTLLVDCQCPAPDLHTFEVAFQSALLQRDLRDLFGVGGVIPLVPRDCSAPSNFTTFIALDIEGSRNNVTEDQLVLIAQIFRDSYNELNALNTQTCDLQFRVVTDVTAHANVAPSGLYLTTPSSTQRQLTSTSSTTKSSTLNRFVLVLTVKGTCRGCKSNTKLFDDTSGRRLLESAMTSSSTLSSFGFSPTEPVRRGMQDNTTALSVDCSCPVGEPSLRAPTTTEVQNSVSTQVLSYNQTGQLTFVTAVQDITSLVTVACSPTVTSFESIITIVLNGVSGAVNLTADDFLTVLSGFTQTYNAITEHFCDPFFRSIEQTNIVSVQSSRRLATTSSSYKLVVKTKGTCRGCKSNTKIFDDTSGRRWLKSRLPFAIDFNSPKQRRLQTAGQCFCDITPVANRAPTSIEFSQAFNNFTSQVLDLGVTSVIETPGSFNGTSSPTIALTASPTIAPSVAPQLSIPPVPAGTNIVCVAVIDEASSPPARVLEIDWVTFRKAFPDRPFCLLQPFPNSPGDLKLPSQFLSDPNVIYARINRDQGNLANASDWYDLCRLGELQRQGFSQVALFVDNSGSFVTVQVQASYNKFQNDVPSRGDSLYAILETTLENYILPFLQLFNYTGTLAPVPLPTTPPQPSIPLTRLPVVSPVPPPTPTPPSTSSQIRDTPGGGQVPIFTPISTPIVTPSVPPTTLPTSAVAQIALHRPITACVAVIDQAGSPVVDLLSPEWDLFRATFPERPFCLLQPVPDRPGELFIPTSFLADPLAIFHRANRDMGAAVDASNWFDLCGFSSLKSAGITRVALWVANSGTMTTSSVLASYELFLSDLSENEFALVADFRGTSEDYILPFITNFIGTPTVLSQAPTGSPPSEVSDVIFTIADGSFSSNSSSSGR